MLCARLDNGVRIYFGDKTFKDKLFMQVVNAKINKDKAMSFFEFKREELRHEIFVSKGLYSIYLDELCKKCKYNHKLIAKVLEKDDPNFDLERFISLKFEIVKRSEMNRKEELESMRRSLFKMFGLRDIKE